MTKWKCDFLFKKGFFCNMDWSWFWLCGELFESFCSMLSKSVFQFRFLRRTSTRQTELLLCFFVFSCFRSRHLFVRFVSLSFSRSTFTWYVFLSSWSPDAMIHSLRCQHFLFLLVISDLDKHYGNALRWPEMYVKFYHHGSWFYQTEFSVPNFFTTVQNS